MLSKYHFHCPHCQVDLTKNNEIKFLVNFNNFNFKLFLSAIPNTYGHKSDIDIPIETGDRLLFQCNSCKTNLQSKKYSDFVEISLKVKTGITFEILFSPICGKKTTYIIMEDEMVKFRDDFFYCSTILDRTA
tara:strand:+ start:133 stop:528 length:396 start_codon:yes stop_codon:yes gene_type:complete